MRFFHWLARLFRGSRPAEFAHGSPVLYVHMPVGSTLAPRFVRAAEHLLKGVSVREVHDRKLTQGVAFSALGFDLEPEKYRELTQALEWSFPEKDLHGAR